MALETMYAGMINSPATELAEAIDDTQTTAVVINGAKLPAAPNICMFGTDENCETVLYAEKVGNNLGSITRAFQGNAKSWEAGTQVSRRFAEKDYASMKANIETLDTDLTAHVGDTTHVGILADNAFGPTDSGTLYPIGISVFSVVGAGSTGWPGNLPGIVINQKKDNSRFVQWFHGLYGSAAPFGTTAWFRFFRVDTWYEWKSPVHIGINEQTGASYTLVISDDGKLLPMNRATAQTLVIPTNASVPLPIGASFMGYQKGAGKVTITGEEGVTLLAFDDEVRTMGQNAKFAGIQVAANTWLIGGDLEVTT